MLDSDTPATRRKMWFVNRSPIFGRNQSGHQDNDNLHVGD